MNNDAFIVQIISIHAPAKGATRELRDADEWEVLFQSTLPRRERLERTLHHKQTDIISIHAPAKGATAAFDQDRRGQWYFNPRSREGSDQRPQQAAAQGAEISIHAPAKGATSRIMSIASTVSIFQSTLPRRERRGRSAHCGTSSTFQSTLPRRERRSAGLAPAFSSMHFNPRSREGSDVAGRPIAASEPFQSTLPRRERRASSAVMGKAAAFQSTLPRRERPDR